jgi:hypothetical protein
VALPKMVRPLALTWAAAWSARVSTTADAEIFMDLMDGRAVILANDQGATEKVSEGRSAAAEELALIF